MESPATGTPNAGDVHLGKNCIFDRLRSLQLRRKFLSIATMVHDHDGALVEKYAMSSTTLVVVEVCLSHIVHGSLQVCM